MKYRSGLIGALALSASVVVASIACSQEREEPAEIVVPAGLSELDPAVRRLIEQKVGSLESRRGDAGAWGDLGLVYEANLLWAEARSCFERAVELAPPASPKPKTALWRFHLAVAIQEAGDFAGALEELRALASNAPSLAPAQERLGLALLAMGDFDAALAAFSRLIELLPSSPNGLLGAADAHLGLGRSGAAVTMLRRALELDPGNRSAHHRLGLALRAEGQLDESRRELALGIGATERKLPPPLAERVEDYAVHVTARVNRAAGLLAAGRAEEASDLLELCVADHPDSITVLNNLAIARLRLGEHRQARSLLDRALAVNDAKFSTWINLTSWALRTGQGEQALEFANGAVARGPDSAQAHANRAQVLLRFGRLGEAAADFENAARLEARDPRPRLAAADLNRRLGRNDRARDLYGEAIDLQPGLLPALLGLSRLELSLGRLAESRRAFEAARAVAPRHPQVLELGRELAQETGGG